MKKLITLIAFVSTYCFAQSGGLLEQLATLEPKPEALEVDLDGLVNEPAWENAKHFSEFKQLSPGLNIPTSEKTSVYLTYDSKYLYIAFDMNSKKVFASVTERDQSPDLDDYVGIFIDSYNDKSNSLVFLVNPLGSRTDFEMIDNGYNINKSWNTFWDAEAVITSTGWSCEIRIPFSSLRFEQARQITMNFRFERIIRHNSEEIVYPLLSTDVDNLPLNMFNVVPIAFSKLSSSTPLYFTPYAAGRVVQNSVLNSGRTKYETKTEVFNGKEYVDNETTDKILSSIGLDIKYKLDNSNTLDLTLNTDFAQAEADTRVVNLTRYSIFFPEKRQFFLENADLFGADLFSHRLFHSRRIGIENGYNVPLLGGFRMTGVFEGIQYGFLNMQSNGLASRNIEAKNFGVFRVRKSLKQDDSYIGGIVTNRISTESNDYNRLVGVDGIYRLSNLITAKFFGAATFDTQTGSSNNKAYGIGFSKLFHPEGFEFDYFLLNYEKNFNPEMGFLSIPNSIQLKLRQGWRFVLPEDYFINRILIGSYNLHYWVSSSRELLYHQSNLYWWFTFRDGGIFHFFIPWYQEDKLDTDWNFSNNITIPKSKYEMWRYELGYESGATSNFSWYGNFAFGDFFGGTQFTIEPGISYIFNKKINVSLDVSYNKLSFPESYSTRNKDYEERIVYSAWLNYNFAADLSLKSFIQYDNISRKVGSNIRLRYNPVEGTDLYLVYNSSFNAERDRFSPQRPFVDEQSVIIKFSKTFIL